MGKNKYKEYPYYETTLGTHMYCVAFLENAVANLVSDKKKIGYHTLLQSHLDDLSGYAKDKNGRLVEAVMSSIPLGGMRYGKNEMARDRDVLTEQAKDVFFEFKKISKHPVYVGTVNLLTSDYGVLQTVSCSFICSYNKDEAEQFLLDYYEWQRARDQFSILNFQGTKMSSFRPMEWDDIFLPRTMAQEIRDGIRVFFDSEHSYAENGVDWRLGMLLAGPPGNGKTAVCRAVATAAKVPVVYCSLDNNDMCAVLKHLKETIAAWAPCVAIIEDADSLVMDMSVRSSFLNMLDGLFSTNGVLTIVSANDADRLGAIFMGRPSRFDSLYVLPNPAPAERESLLVRRVGKKLRLTKSQLKNLVARTDGLSAAFIQEVVSKAFRKSLQKGRSMDYSMLIESLAIVEEHVVASEHGIDKLGCGNLGFAES